MTIPALALAQVPTQGIQIGNAAIPAEGPKALPFLFDFNTATAFQVDILFLYQQKLISVLQVLFVDNSQGNGPFMATFTGTGQNIVVPEGAQGYYPILCPLNGKMTVKGSNPAGEPIQVYLINVPMSVLQWEPAGDGFLFTNTGALKTADVALDALITSTPSQGQTALNVNIVADEVATGGGGGAPYCQAGTLALGFGQNFYTNAPGGSNFFTLASLEVLLDPGTYRTAGAGYETIEFGWAGAPETNILTFPIWGQAAAPGGYPQSVFKVEGLALKTAIVSGSFDMTTSGGWAGGGLQYRITGTFSAS